MKQAMFVAVVLLAGWGRGCEAHDETNERRRIHRQGRWRHCHRRYEIDASDMRRTCLGTMRSEEESRLRELAAAARPETWPESFANAAHPHGSPDQIRYTISVGEDSTSWYGEAGEGVPHEILKLRDALVAVQQRVLKDCP